MVSTLVKIMTSDAAPFLLVLLGIILIGVGLGLWVHLGLGMAAAGAFIVGFGKLLGDD